MKDDVDPFCASGRYDEVKKKFPNIKKGLNENRDLHNTRHVFDRLRFYSDYDISDGDVIESEEIRLL